MLYLFLFFWGLSSYDFIKVIKIKRSNPKARLNEEQRKLVSRFVTFGIVVLYFFLRRMGM